jgi:hypothetical protein
MAFWRFGNSAGRNSISRCASIVGRRSFLPVEWLRYAADCNLCPPTQKDGDASSVAMQIQVRHLHLSAKGFGHSQSRLHRGQFLRRHFMSRPRASSPLWESMARSSRVPSCTAGLLLYSCAVYRRTRVSSRARGRRKRGRFHFISFLGTMISRSQAPLARWFNARQ